jgi:UDP-N-acetylmuramoyl-L-alanyl-D-glutamate--2,6-diaminopimelate ligase
VPEFTLLTPRNPIGATLDRLTAADVRLVTGDPATRVRSGTVNDAEVIPGGLFAALPGRYGHGAHHWERARTAGAVAVLTDLAGVDIIGTGRGTGAPPTLLAADPRAVLGRIAARVNGTDRHRPTLFGVTGTNGKTTTVHLVDAILEQLGVPAGHSSTADRRSGDTVVASRLTSPEAPELHALLARMLEDGVRAASLEVSAQALSRHRVDDIVFDVAGFTNLSHDHMDDYGTMSDYLAAKLGLFTPQHAVRGVVVLDSPAGPVIRDRSTIPVTTLSSVPGTTAEWTVAVLDMTTAGTRFSLTGPDGRHLTTSVPLIGRHMAVDAGLAIVMLTEAGFALPEIALALEDGIRVTIPGRTELASGPTGPRVYTDFSHTPDSVEKTLLALRLVTPGRLIVIIGADGDKDPSKRVPMGRAAAEHADVVIVTDHHPRFEDPVGIRRALLDGATQIRTDGIAEHPEPSVAIRAAVAMAGEHDTILWVGPGQTDYRVVRDRDVRYSPRNDARRALAEAGWAADAS